MSVCPLDGPVPDLPETEHLKSRAALLLQMARREKLTLRQLFHRVAAARGHLLLVAGPGQIADTLEAWFRAGAADGFNVMPPFLSRPVRRFRQAGRADPAGTRPVPGRL
jgi:alkanesulfonate monooxygenase SsuD/methylene tetrahydromethanopterin reductase-like flavin-dependent oxidoreductase (luciferase family)